MQKLVKKLRREIKANPQKAAVLGGMLAIAAWFWAPLISGWFAPAGAAPKPAAVATSAAIMTNPVANAALSVAGAVVASAPNVAWQQLANAIETDPAMRPAARIVHEDPFGMPPAPVVESVKVEAIDPQAVAEETTFNPESLGLTLTSTIVGSRRKTARINGKNYAPHDSVSVPSGNAIVTFEIAEIDSRRAVLSRLGHRFELKLPLSGQRSGAAASSENEQIEAN